MPSYKIIEIFSSETVRWQGKPLSEAVIEYVRSKKIAARCQMVRAVEGCFENGDAASAKMDILPLDLPTRITIVLPAAQAESILPQIRVMVSDGIVGIQDIQVVSYKTRRQLIPKHIRVKDVMTPDPQKACLHTPVSRVVELLLSHHFTGIPVVDAACRPQGVISQGDLITRAKMPLRLGMLASTDAGGIQNVMQSLSRICAEKIMTRPAVCIREDGWLTEAVDLMLKKSLKRLPVIDGSGILSGILSRQDIFHITTREQPDWHAFDRQQIQMSPAVHPVSDIMRRDTRTVFPDTPVMDIIHIIDADDVQRVAVVDAAGRFLGLISDKDLISAFSEHSEGIWELFLKNLPMKEKRKKAEALHPDILNKTAGDVMNKECITVRENASIDEAIGMIASLGVKRLPVLDAAGRFKGLIRRESLMRIGYGFESESRLRSSF